MFLDWSGYLFLSTATVFCLNGENCIGEDDQSHENDVADKNYSHSVDDVRRNDPSNTDRDGTEQHQLKINKIYCETLQHFMNKSHCIKAEL